MRAACGWPSPSAPCWPTCPHAAPVSVIGTAYDPDVVDRPRPHPVAATRAPPASSACCTTRWPGPGWTSASLWAAVPELRAVGARRRRRSSRWSSAPPGCSTSAWSHHRPRDRVGELRAAGHRAGRGRRRHRGLRPAPRGGAGGGGRPGRLRRRGRALPARPARFLKLAGPLGRPRHSVTGVGTTMAVMVRRARRRTGEAPTGARSA